MFQDGPNGEPAGRCQERADAKARREVRAANHDRGNDISTGITTTRAWAAAAIRIGPSSLFCFFSHPTLSDKLFYYLHFNNT